MKKNKRSLRHCMRKRWLIIIIIPIIQIFFLPSSLFARLPQQTYLLKGTITDTKGVPLPGVTIRLEGTSIGIASDNEGMFSLNLPQPKGVLVCSSIGYKTVKASFIVPSSIPLLIKMEEAVSELDEVQVIAYGTQSKREMTGAMSIVKAAEIKDVPSPSVGNLLQGRVSGMSVVNSTGAPGGGGTNISIRGYNSLSIETGRRGSEPLWVIDGVPVFSFTSPATGLNTLAEIDPADIETIQVLKDAQSSSIYGSRAANGVILVTTKKGRLNQKARFSANVSHTFSIKTFLPEQTGGNAERRLRLQALNNYATAYFDKETNTYRYPENWDEALENKAVYGYFYGNGRGTGISVLQDSLNEYYNRSSNLMGYYFRPVRVTDANLQLSGGADRIAYNVGLGYYTEKGTLRNTGFNRVKLISNLYLNPFPKMESNLRFYLARTGRDRSGNGLNMINNVVEGDLEKIPAIIMEGTSLQKFNGDQHDRIKEKNESYRLRSSFDLSYEIIRGLKIKSSLAVDYSQQNLHVFKPLELDEYNETYTLEQINRSMMWLNENTINYKRTFNDHSVDLLAGLSFQEEKSNVLSGYGKGNINQLQVIGKGSPFSQDEYRILKDVQSDMAEIASVGVFFRGDYNYRKKYLFSTTFRWDASSTFGENNRWGMFPSFAVGYAFSEENFMKHFEWLNYGKIRASWGTSGRRFESPYLAHGVLQLSDQTYNGNQTIEPDWVSGLLNTKLSWEETRQWDVGLDMDFMEHRIGFTFDWYRRYTDKLLAKVPIPSPSPFFNQWRNAYAICNSGIELQIKADIIRKENLNWNVTFNIARNWNKLVKSNNGRDFQNRNFPNNISIIGKPLNQILAYDDRGYYNSQDKVPYIFVNGRKQYLGNTKQYYRPGDRVIADADGDGTILGRYPNQDDRKLCGSPLPLAQGGIISNLTWKGFDVNFLFNYMIGRHILNAAKYAGVGTMIQADPDKMIVPVFADLGEIDFWEKPGDRTDLPVNRADGGLYNFATNLASNVENVSFLRLKTVVIGYTLPESIQKVLGFSCRIFVSGENLFCLTNYSGTDPESVDLTTGVDYYNNYPLSRKVTVGLTLNF